jgi:lysophospholipase L1-like esterase
MRIIYPALFCSFVLNVLSAQACSPDQVAYTTTPTPPTDTATIELTQRLIASMPASADVIMVGDSLVQYWPQDQLQRAFGRAKIWNFGVGGNKTQTVLSRLTGDKLSLLKPSIVIILNGTVNVGGGNEACAVVAGLAQIARRTASLWPTARIYFLSIPPRGDDFAFKDKEIREINSQIALSSVEFVNSKKLEIDTGALTCGHYGKPLPEGAIKFDCGNYWNDHLHFSATGYEILTRSLLTIPLDKVKLQR